MGGNTRMRTQRRVWRSVKTVPVRGVVLPVVGRGQLQDLQPRDVDSTLFRKWDCNFQDDEKHDGFEFLENLGKSAKRPVLFERQEM